MNNPMIILLVNIQNKQALPHIINKNNDKISFI